MVERQRALERIHQHGVADARPHESVVGSKSESILETSDHARVVAQGFGERRAATRSRGGSFRARLAEEHRAPGALGSDQTGGAARIGVV
jgi:hypothetical protein